MSSKKVGLGLLGAAWIALGVAAVGVTLTPTDWCGELPTPGGETTALVPQALSSRRIVMKGVGVPGTDITAPDTPLNAPADLARAVCPELQ